MDKEWLLSYLKPEHLPGDDMQDVAETCGIETVKKLIEECETIRLYVPKIQSLKSLFVDVIIENKDYMTIAELQKKTGLSRDKIKAIIRAAEKRRAG